jgi:hypothetical protein
MDSIGRFSNASESIIVNLNPENTGFMGNAALERHFAKKYQIKELNAQDWELMIHKEDFTLPRCIYSQAQHHENQFR